MWLVGPWVTASIGAEWHSSKWVSMSFLCWALEGRSVGHGGPQVSVRLPPPALCHLYFI